MKTIISANIEADIAQYLKTNRINKSQLIDQLLHEWIATRSKERLQTTIQEQETTLNHLKTINESIHSNIRKKDTTEKMIYQSTFDDLLQGYTKRRKEGIDPRDDIMWITGTRNKQKCLTIQMTPEEALIELSHHYKTQGVEFQ